MRAGWSDINLCGALAMPDQSPDGFYRGSPAGIRCFCSGSFFIIQFTSFIYSRNCFSAHLPEIRLTIPSNPNARLQQRNSSNSTALPPASTSIKTPAFRRWTASRTSASLYFWDTLHALRSFDYPKRDAFFLGKGSLEAQKTLKTSG